MSLFTRQVPFCFGHEDMKMVRSAGFAPALQRWHGRVLLLNDDRMKWRSHKDLHLELPPSQSGVHGSYTLRALKMVRHAGAAPARSVWKTDMLAVTSMPREKMAAGVGSAPTSAGLQPAAHLSEPSSVLWKWSLGVVTLHGLSLIGRVLCC